MILEIVLGVTLLIGLTIKLARRPKNFPPGPIGLPIVGYVPFMNKHDPSGYTFKSFAKMSEKYGSVVGFFLGPSQPFIAVCGYEAVKEALHNQDLDGRINTNSVKIRTFGERLGLIFTDGDHWNVQRRFFLRHLRDLGFGQTSSENLIQDEINDIIQEIRAQAQSSNGLVNFSGMFNLSLLNILWALIGGERFKHDDAKLKRLVDAVKLFFRAGNQTRGGIPVPKFLIKHVPLLRKVIGLRTELFNPVQEFIRECIKQHKRNPPSDGSPRDFIDVYLLEMSKSTHQEGNTTFHTNQLIAAVTDLFFAGAETTSNSIGWVLLYLIYHPEVQMRVQAELDEVCGDSLPLLVHRPSLPYTEAVLMETLRIANTTPFTVPHRAMKDTKLQGFFIPEGTIAMINLYSVHMERTYWKDPEIFRPERHIDSKGNIIKTDHLLPFGAGRRMCLGESLARKNFYLYTTALLKTFEFAAVSGQPLPTLLPNYGITNSYDGFTAKVTPRN